MKQAYLFLSAILVASASFGQSNMQPLDVPTKSIANKSFSHKEFSKTHQNNQNTKKAIQNYWVSYVDHYANIYGSTPYGYTANNIFPDSTILVDYGSSGFGSTWIHAVSQLFDLSAPVVASDGITVNPARDFTIDSIAAVCIYNRVDNSVTDTLRFQILAPTVGQMDGVSYFFGGGVDANLNPGDTVFMMNTNWDYATLSTPGVVAEYKVPLDAAFYADTNANGIHFAQIATNNDIIYAASGVYGNKFSITMDFIPGYSWVPNGDTLNYNKNSLRFAAFELEGQGTYPIYSKDDFNLASVVPQDVRYNNAGGWNGSYVPSYAYMGSTPGWSYEAFAIQTYISQEDGVGVEELTQDFSFNVYPNPSNGEFNIRLTSNEAENVNLIVRDIVGKTVVNQTVAVAGNTTANISLKDFSKGVYFLTVGNKTEKLIVE